MSFGIYVDTVLERLDVLAHGIFSVMLGGVGTGCLFMVHFFMCDFPDSLGLVEVIPFPYGSVVGLSVGPICFDCITMRGFIG